MGPLEMWNKLANHFAEKTATTQDAAIQELGVVNRTPMRVDEALVRYGLMLRKLQDVGVFQS